MLKFFIAAAGAVYTLAACYVILFESDLPIPLRVFSAAAVLVIVLLTAAALSWRTRARRKGDNAREALRAILGSAFPWSKAADDQRVREALKELRKHFPGAFFSDEDDEIDVVNLLKDMQDDTPQAFKDDEMNWDVLLAATRQGQESFDRLKITFEGAFPIGDIRDVRMQIILGGLIQQFPHALRYDLRDKPARVILGVLSRYFPNEFPDGKVNWQKLIPRISTLHQVLKDLRGKFKKSFPGGKGPADQKDEILVALHGHFPDVTPEELDKIRPDGKQVDWEEFVYKVYSEVAQQRLEAKAARRRLEAKDAPPRPEPSLTSRFTAGLQNSYEHELSRFPVIASGAVSILLASFILMADPTGLIHIAAAFVIMLFVAVVGYKVFIVYPLKAYISPAFEKRDGDGRMIVNPKRLNPEFTAHFARHLVLCLMRSQKWRTSADWEAHPVLLGSSRQGEPKKIKFGELLQIYDYWVAKRADRVFYSILVLALGLSMGIVIGHIVEMWWIGD